MPNSLKEQAARYAEIRKRLMGPPPQKEQPAKIAAPILVSIKPVPLTLPKKERQEAQRIKYQHALRELQAYTDGQLRQLAEDARRKRRIAALVAKFRCVYDVPGDVIRDVQRPEGEGRRMTADILKDICAAYGVTANDIKSVRRNRHIVLARQAAYYAIAMERPELSMPLIGKILGGKDHTTVLHGIRSHAYRHNLPLGGRHVYLAKKKGWKRVIQPTEIHMPTGAVNNCSQPA
jgi:chromosomal replication initiator protein